MRDRRGFTLLEVLIAVAILGVGIVAVMQLFPASMRQTQVANERTAATAVANSELSRLRAARSVQRFRLLDGTQHRTHPQRDRPHLRPLRTVGAPPSHARRDPKTCIESRSPFRWRMAAMRPLSPMLHRASAGIVGCVERRRNSDWAAFPALGGAARSALRFSLVLPFLEKRKNGDSPSSKCWSRLPFSWS